MARVNVPAQTTPGAYPTLPIGANTRDLTMQAGYVALGNDSTLVDAKTLVIVQNTDSGAQTVTFTSVADSPFNRPGDITAYSIGAGELALFGPFKMSGWAHSTKLWIDVSDATVKIAVITLP